MSGDAKICTVCRASKPRDEFSPHVSGGVQSRCKACAAAIARDSRAAARKLTPSVDELRIGADDARRCVHALLDLLERAAAVHDDGSATISIEDARSLAVNIPRPQRGDIIARCDGCGDELVYAKFPRDEHTHSGRATRCRDCRRL